MKTADELLTMAWLTLTIYPARESTELVRQQIKEYLDAPKPEPVAWRLRPPPRFETDEGVWHFHDDSEAVEKMRDEKGWTVEPLYANIGEKE